MRITDSEIGENKIPGKCKAVVDGTSQRSKLSPFAEPNVLAYPLLVRDPDYRYAKLYFLLGDIDPASFRMAFDGIARAEWIHQFTGGLLRRMPRLGRNHLANSNGDDFHPLLSGLM